MPAAPVIEKVALDVFNTLKGITVVDGFSIDLLPQRRKRGNKNNPAHGLCVIYQDDPVQDALTTGAPNGTIFWKVQFALEIHLIQSEKADDAIDTLINYAVADVQRALMSDPRRGENAHDTILGDPKAFDDTENSYSGVFIPFEIQYGHLLADPTTPI
jgi:hypothetical protein